MVEDGAVKFLLGGEMPEHHGLGHSSRLRDFFGSCAAKTSLRKETDGDAKDLESAAFRAHAGSADNLIRGFRNSFWSIDFFAQGRYFCGHLPKVSTYLPSREVVCQEVVPC